VSSRFAWLFEVLLFDGAVVSALLADGAEALAVAVADDERAASAIAAAEEAAGASWAVGFGWNSVASLRWVFFDFGDHGFNPRRRLTPCGAWCRFVRASIGWRTSLCSVGRHVGQRVRAQA
jgi:hypothetical protein